jgi:hypothetical protein
VSRDLLLFGPLQTTECKKFRHPHISLIVMHPHFSRFLQTASNPEQTKSGHLHVIPNKRPQTPLGVFASSKHCSHHIILNRVFIANSLEKRNQSWKCPAGCREADLVLSTGCSHPSPRIKARGTLDGRDGSVSNLRKFSLEGYCYQPC